MSVLHCFSTKYLTTNISHIINQFRLRIFIFNFQNLGLIILNLIKKKTVHIIILLIFPLPWFSFSNYHQITDALHNCCWDNLWTFPKQLNGLTFVLIFECYLLHYFHQHLTNKKPKQIVFIIFINYSMIK